MAIIASKKSGDGGTNFEPIEPGTYAARCVKIMQIGTITETFNGDTKTRNKVLITWEIASEMRIFKEDEGEKPYLVSKEVALSLGKKSTLKPMLEAWRGKPFTEAELDSFDITKLIGACCMVSIVHSKPNKDGNIYANVDAVAKLMKGLTVPPQITPSFIFDFDPFDQAKFDSLPDYWKDKIKGSAEYHEAMNGKPAVATTSVNASTQEPEEEPLPF